MTLFRSIAPSLVCACLLAACDGKPAVPSPAQPPAHAGGGEKGEEENMIALPARAIGPVKIGVEVPKDLGKAAEAHLHVEVEGQATGKLRVWVGAESGEGSVKTAADLSSGEKHLEVELPKTLADAKVWVEVEADGKTDKGGFDLPKQ